MLAAFWCEEPAWLVIVFAAGCALITGTRVGRRSTAGAPRPQIVAWLGGAMAGLCAAVLGGVLVRIGTAGALGFLIALAILAMGWGVLTSYQWQWAGVSPLTRMAVLPLRILAGVLLLLMLAQPVWDWMQASRQKPLLVALLDQSDSLNIVDGEDAGGKPSRATIANSALADSRAALRQLEQLYEVRLRGVGSSYEPIENWQIKPQAPLTALTAALNAAGRMRSRYGAPPLAVLLLSDGADTVSTARELRSAAAELAEQGTGLLAVGVGPQGALPLVELEPLVLPERLGARDRVRVPVSARVEGCAGATLAVELMWDDEPVATRQIPVDFDLFHVGAEFDLIPPSAGVHRLTVRIRLPRQLGRQVFQTSAVVNVRDEDLRILYLEGAPRAEAAFLTRAWQGDHRLVLTRRFLFPGTGGRAYAFEGGRIEWAEYDVVVLGCIPAVLSNRMLDDLVTAVSERGVGLLLAGGRQLFNDGDFQNSALESVSPVKLIEREFGLAGPVRFVPTDTGLRHPILQGTGLPEDLTGSESLVDERANWLTLPALGGAAVLSDPRPAASLLATEGTSGQPLLVATEVGRGRCVAAAWENTWPWALASPEGAILHRRLWRQLITWLANRRPRAWVLTDQPVYATDAFAARQDQVHIRAGVSGLGTDTEGMSFTNLKPRLTVTVGKREYEVNLDTRDAEWRATLPANVNGLDMSQAGTYILELTVSGLTGDNIAQERAEDPEVLAGRGGFIVEQTRLERQAPTANLPLLQSAAELTSGQGGAYIRIEQLPEFLAEMARHDRRRVVHTRQYYSPVEHEPWVLLGALVFVLVLEWIIRKRVSLP
ncbi:MAG: hypothetical protein ABIG44_07570 [Planctomycetota bacterium]